MTCTASCAWSAIGRGIMLQCVLYACVAVQALRTALKTAHHHGVSVQRFTMSPAQWLGAALQKCNSALALMSAGIQSEQESHALPACWCHLLCSSRKLPNTFTSPAFFLCIITTWSVISLAYSLVFMCSILSELTAPYISQLFLILKKIISFMHILDFCDYWCLHFLIIFSTLTFFTYRLSRGYKAKACSCMSMNSKWSQLDSYERQKMLMNPKSKLRGNIFFKFCTLKIHTRKNWVVIIHILLTYLFQMLLARTISSSNVILKENSAVLFIWLLLYACGQAPFR